MSLQQARKLVADQVLPFYQKGEHLPLPQLLKQKFDLPDIHLFYFFMAYDYLIIDKVISNKLKKL